MQRFLTLKIRQEKPGDDIDSTPDSDQGDALLDDAIFNELNEEGLADEDDHDIASVSVDFLDLALRKTIDSQSDTPLVPGSTVTFAIEVFNQGTVDAGRVQVVDYLPTTCLTLADANWVASAPGVVAYSSTLDIPVGESDMIFIDFVVEDGCLGTIDNYAEISAATDAGGLGYTDIDSDPDAIPGDVLVNDEILDDGTVDEDDHDIASVELGVFDLALRKTISTMTIDPIDPSNNTVTFEIEVFNQGNVDAVGVQVTDYIPTGLILNDVNWVMSGATTAELVENFNLLAGTSNSVFITFDIAEGTTGQIDNYAEISEATGGPGFEDYPDVDSTPDSTPGDILVDDEILDDGTDDEDDHDIATIIVPEPNQFDLALRKTLYSQTDTPLIPGTSQVTFQIEVFNQGTIEGQNVVITDYLPTEGITLNDANWTMNGAGTEATSNVVFNVPVNESYLLYIIFDVDAGFSGTVDNYAEISDAEDPTGATGDDIDSTPDSDQGDELVDDEIFNDGTTDEDDHDIASISVGFLDLALRKTIDSQSDTPLVPGSTVTFAIEVFNQGTVDAAEIQVVDYLPPTCLILDDANWLATSAGVAEYSSTLDIAVGKSDVIFINFVVDNGCLGTIDNYAEISAATDAAGLGYTDIDSDPDAEPGDQLTDDEIDEDGKAGGDEDDHDIASVELGVFDLALRKTVSTMTIDPIDPSNNTVTFELEVFNQGTVNAVGIELTDYIPFGLILNDVNWNNNGDGTATTVENFNLLAGESTSVFIAFDIAVGVTGQIDNYAEISEASGGPGFEDYPDIDSTPDSDQGDVLVDDEILDDGTDDEE